MRNLTDEELAETKALCEKRQGELTKELAKIVGKLIRIEDEELRRSTSRQMIQYSVALALTFAGLTQEPLP